MTKKCLLLFFILLFCGSASAQDWKVLKGEHFLIYYFEDENFAGEVLARAEKYYDKIASDLGYSRYDNFWQWENRVKIYIYRNRDEFSSSIGSEKWIGGIARYNEKEIISYRWSEGFLDSLLPHELTHLIFRDFVGFKGKIPLWMDEGVAEWEEEPVKDEAMAITRKLVSEGSFIPLADLMQMDTIRKDDYNLLRKFYTQAVSLVDYLIKEYGGSKFTLFCRQLRDGKSIDAALSFTYTDSIRGTNELEKKWTEYYGGGHKDGK